MNGLDYMLFAIIADSTGDDGTNERFGYVDAAHVAKMEGYYTDDSFDTFLSLRLSVLGAIMAVLPLTPGAVIGIPMSLWALAIFNFHSKERAYRLGGRAREQCRDAAKT